MYSYHIPPRRRPKSDDGYLEILAQSVFQAGFSWEVVRKKWPNFRRAFYGFRVARVAAMGPRDVSRLLRDASIIRNGEKLTAVIQNARVVQRLKREHGSFRNFITSLRPLSYAKRRHALAKTFRWIGPTGAYHFFWCVGENVPEWEDRNR